MRGDVDFQVPLIFIGFLTDVALEGLLTGVDSHVCLQMCPPNKCFPAFRAAVSLYEFSFFRYSITFFCLVSIGTTVIAMTKQAVVVWSV